MISLAMGEIKLFSGDVLCPAAHPGQRRPGLPAHTLELKLSEGRDLIAPKSWAVTNPDSSLAACSRSGRGRK